MRTFREREQRLAQLERAAEASHLCEPSDLTMCSDAQLESILGADAPFYASLSDAQLGQLLTDPAAYDVLRAAYRRSTRR